VKWDEIDSMEVEVDTWRRGIGWCVITKFPTCV